jgi:tetratricopeptide (TPR) repeat protein
VLEFVQMKKSRFDRSTLMPVVLIFLSILPIISSMLAPADHAGRGVISNFLDSPYYLIALFMLYFVVIGVMSWDGSRASRERKRANEAIALIDLQYRNGDTLAVIKDCQDQLSAYPNDAALHWYLALATYAQKDFQVARPHFLKAAEIDARFESAVQPFLEKMVSEAPSEPLHQQHLH